MPLLRLQLQRERSRLMLTILLASKRREAPHCPAEPADAATVRLLHIAALPPPILEVVYRHLLGRGCGSPTAAVNHPGRGV
jgi:hypothetical protein